MEHSQNKLKIYFRDEEVFNIKIQFNNTNLAPWDGKQKWAQHYVEVRAFYDCNGLQLAATGKENEMDGEMYVPATSIRTLAIDYLPGHKFEQS